MRFFVSQFVILPLVAYTILV